MASLERREAGGFSIERALTISELENMTVDERVAELIPTESLFADLARVELPAFYEKLCRNGCEIYQKKIGTDFELTRRVALYGKSGFFALGEVRDYPDGSAIKSIKIFEL